MIYDYQGNEISISPLKGKKILAIGDSFVQGHTLNNTQTWVYKLATRNNMAYFNYGINGASIAYDSSASYTSISSKLQEILNNVSATDYIVLLGGHNDANPNEHGGTAVTIGENTDNVNTTFKGALNIITTSLLTKYPKAKMLFLSPFNRHNYELPYVEAMKDIAGLYSQWFFDCYNGNGITFNIQAVKNAYDLSNTLHLNEDGQERFSYVVQALLEQM